MTPLTRQMQAVADAEHRGRLLGKIEAYTQAAETMVPGSERQLVEQWKRDAEAEYVKLVDGL